MLRPNHTTWVTVALALIAALASSAEAQTAGHAADRESLPPIECPLHKAGIAEPAFGEPPAVCP